MQHDAPRRPNRFEIDLGAIAHNLSEVRRVVRPKTRIIAALKADAYGFGLGKVADLVVSGGGDGIAVSDLSDAELLRERGVELPILLYAGNLVDPKAIAAVQAFGLMPTIFDRAGAEAYSALAARPLQVFVKIDVGLERIGVHPSGAVSLISHVRRLPNLVLHGLYTHLHVPDDPKAQAYIAWQLERYSRVCEALKRLGVEIPVRMVASSAVLRYSREMAMDAVDPGHVLFGQTPPGPVTVTFDLRPAFRALTSRLIHVKKVDRREYRDLAPIPLREGLLIGIIPIGLRDGMASLSCGSVLVSGRRVSTLGPMSLEHTRVDLTDVPEARVGDEVVIIGQQGDIAIRPEEVIEHQGFAVEPELAMAVRASVERIYV